MALRILLAVASLQCVVPSFEVTNPALQAEPVLQSNRWWHLGGFCFGQVDGAPAAKLVVSMLWGGQAPLRDSAQVYLVAFDGREDRWGAARRDWETSSCEQKVALSSASSLLTSHASGSLMPQQEAAFTINIHQKTATRDWHYVLLACGTVEAAPFKVTVEAEHGAFSIFAANNNFDSSSCPVIPVSWWWHAAEDPAFWVLLFAAAIISSCGSVGVMLCFRPPKLASTTRNARGSTDVVLGKPCETAKGEIIEGQVNAMTATHDANVCKQV
eukprot:Skav216939  [mRNA]  locus=scaffold3396:39974:40786:+ [translate_table: standard]